MKELDSNILAFLKSWFGSQNQDQTVFELMKLSVGRILTKTASPDENIFAEVDRPDVSIQHIYDWLCVAVKNNEYWLTNVDDHGRPKKLMKLGTIEQAVKEADKAMDKENQRLGKITLMEGHEIVYAELQNGYKLVRMLKPEALDRESSLMQHCIGHGSYDDRLHDKTFLYLSLRDRHGHPHATFEIEQWGENLFVNQMVGKQNQPPLNKYLRQLDCWDMLSSLEFGDKKSSSLILDEKFRIYSTADLPDDFTAIHDIVFTVVQGGKNLPKRLRALKDVRIVGLSSKPVSLPEGWVVEGDLQVRHQTITEIPAGTIVKGEMDLRGSKIGSIGDGCVFGSLILREGEVNKIGSGVKISELLSLLDTKIKNLPSDIELKSLAAPGDALKVLPSHIKEYSTLVLEETRIKTLPEGLTVDRLFLGNTTLDDMPKSLTVNDCLNLTRSIIKTVHGSWKLIGSASFIGSTIEKMTGIITVENDMGIDLSETTIRKLPDAIICDGTVSFHNAHIKTLPKKVHCVTLDLRGCDLKMDRLPEFDIQCHTVIISKAQAHMILPKTWKVMNVTVKADSFGGLDFVIKDANDFRPKKTAKPKFARERRRAAA